MNFCPEWIGRPSLLTAAVAALWVGPFGAASAAEAKASGEAKAAEPAKPERAAGEAGGAGATKTPTANEDAVAVAKPVTGDLMQVYGWRETIVLDPSKLKLRAKLDSGAITSSIHAEETELFERDGKKWVRFLVLDPTSPTPVRHKVEAPLVRIARIKQPGGESRSREVVRLAFQIGERKVRAEFTLNNRSNMLAPVLLGRTIIKDLGWVDCSRTDLADEKLFR